MNSYLFIGRILPERTPLDIPKLIFKGLSVPDGKLESLGELHVEAKNGKITANLITSETYYLATIKNSVEFFLRVIVDSFGYYTGQAFDIDIELVSGPGQAYTFYPRVNSLFNNQKDRPFPPEEILEIAVRNISVLRALGNLREAIIHPIDVGLFTYRAIESIHQHFVEPGASKKQSWVDMRNALNVSENFINDPPSLTDHSEKARHGETNNITDEDMEAILHKAWKVVDRFCIYLNEKETDLDIKKYPLL